MLNRRVPSRSRLSVGLGQEAFKVPANDPVALARDVFQPGPVGYRDRSLALRDQTRRLQRARYERDRGTMHAEHLG